MAFSRIMDVTARSVLCDEAVSSRAKVGDCFGIKRLAMTPGCDFEKAIVSTWAGGLASYSQVYFACSKIARHNETAS
jgi:hypothetical protein